MSVRFIAATIALSLVFGGAPALGFILDLGVDEAGERADASENGSKRFFARREFEVFSADVSSVALKAYFLNGDNILELTANKKSIGKPLPDELLIEPGSYEVKGAYYNLKREGLYRFISPEQSIQRIVFERDVFSLVSSLSWVVTHGLQDQRLSNDELENTAMGRKIFLTCGPTTQLAKYILGKYGIESRSVSFFKVEDLNNFSDGHIMLEVNINNTWVLFDIDDNIFFEIDGKALSLWEFLSSPVDSVEIKMLSKDVKVAISTLFLKEKDGGLNDLSLFFETYYYVDPRRWIEDVTVLPAVVDDDGAFYTPGFKKGLADALNERRKEMGLASLKFNFLQDREFVERFYGAPPS